jgi:hypothetical protein
MFLIVVEDVGRSPDGSWPDGSDGWMDFSPIQGICRVSSHTHYAWVNPHIHGSECSVITLCQDYVEEWFSNWQGGDTLPQIVQGDRVLGSGTHLNDYSGRSIILLISSKTLLTFFQHGPFCSTRLRRIQLCISVLLKTSSQLLHNDASKSNIFRKEVKSCIRMFYPMVKRAKINGHTGSKIYNLKICLYNS